MSYKITNAQTIPPESVIHCETDRQLCEEAYSFIMDDQAREAIAILEKMHEKYPENQIISNNLSAAYIKNDQGQLAVELTKEIYRKHPKYLYAMINMSHIYLDEGETNKVKKIFGGASTLNEVFPERDAFNIIEVEQFHFLMSRYNAMIGNLEEARHLRDYLKHLNPRSKLSDLVDEFITAKKCVDQKQQHLRLVK